jgi:hypothetical protein
MVFEYQQRRIEEALKRLTEMDRALGRSQAELLLASRIHEQSRAVSEAQKLIEESIRASAQFQVKNAIVGMSLAARHAMEKTVAGFHALSVSSVQRATDEALAAIQISRAQQDVLRNVRALRNAAVHAHFGPSLAALGSTLPKGTLERAAQAIAEANRIDISKLGAISGSSALAALDYSMFNDDLKQIQAIHNSYSGQLAAAFRELFNSPEISDDTVKPIQELINAKINSLPTGRISAEGLLTLILTLMSVLIAYGNLDLTVNQSRGSEKTSATQAKQLAQLAGLIRQLVINTSRLLPERDQNTYYVVEREAVLRLKPVVRSAVLGSLFPNQKVRLAERSHKWIYVEYFDEIEGVPRYGWAYKKYFRYVSSPTLSKRFRHDHSWHSKSSELLSSEEHIAITDRWEDTNARRVGLIQKKINGTISNIEEDELEYLQSLADKRIQLFAPLPIDQLKTALNEVTRSN